MFATVLLSALALSSPQVEEPVAFRPGPRFEGGLVRSLSSSYDIQFESITASMGDAEVPAEFLPALEIEASSERSLVVRDEPLEAGSSRGVRRTFEELEGSGQVFVAMTGEVQDDRESTVSSPLAGVAVLFERESEREDFAPRLEAGVEAELPEDLRFDLDLIALLPREPVDVGDRWECAADALDALLEPCGAGLWVWSDDLDGDDDWADEPEQTGALDVTFTGWAEGQQGRLARLVLRGEVTTTKSRPSDLEEIPVTQGPGTETQVDVQAWSGELIWDVAEGRMHAFEAAAEMRSTTTLATAAEAEGPAFESTVLLIGETRITASVEAE